LNDKERLQKIIDDWQYGKENEEFPTLSLEDDDVEWLIEKVKTIIS
jgi:hypothetical protein